MKTSDLNGFALDYAVADCDGIDHDTALLNITVGDDNGWFFSPSKDWLIGGAIIEREKISLSAHKNQWMASLWMNRDAPPPYTPEHRSYRLRTNICAVGETPLIAAMRCYVLSKMGDEVIIPEELTKEEA